MKTLLETAKAYGYYNDGDIPNNAERVTKAFTDGANFVVELIDDIFQTATIREPSNGISCKELCDMVYARIKQLKKEL